MSEYGVDTNAVSVPNVISGHQNLVTRALMLDAGATAALGQVVQYDGGANKYADATDATGIHYGVVIEAKTLSGDAPVMCVIQGKVFKNALDSVTKANPDMIAKLLAQGIIAEDSAVV